MARVVGGELVAGERAGHVTQNGPVVLALHVEKQRGLGILGQVAVEYELGVVVADGDVGVAHAEQRYGYGRVPEQDHVGEGSAHVLRVAREVYRLECRVSVSFETYLKGK